MRAVGVGLAVFAACFAVAAATAAGDVTVWSGGQRHVAWSLVATDGESGSFCLTMRKKGRLDASECGSIFGGPAHGVTYLAHFGRPGPNYIVGPVVARARRIVVSLSDGTELVIPTIAPPRGLVPSIRFYVRLMPCRSVQVRRIVGINANGRTVASIQPHPLGPHITC